MARRENHSSRQTSGEAPGKKIARPRKARPQSSRAQTAGSRKSSTKGLLDILRRGGDVREDKVQRIRRAILERRYENNLKLEIAIQRLLD